MSLYFSNLSSFHHFGKVKTVDSVKQLHAQLVKLPSEGRSDWDLIRAYMRFCDYKSSVTVFFMGSVQNYLAWKRFLQEYERFGGNPCGILEVFGELNRKGVDFDSWVLTVVLKLCALLLDVWLGTEVHAYLIKQGLDLNVNLRSALLDFYESCYGADHAQKVFDEMPNRAAPLWREIIAANLQNSDPDKALQLFQEMQFSCIKPDCFTVAKVLQACGKIGAFDEGKQIHGFVLRNVLERELGVCNSMINFYAKNGEIMLARNVFDSMEEHDLSSWNSMISGYATLGYFAEAWKLFDEMESGIVTPDEVTWNCLLSSHFQHGLYQEVLTILQRMLMSKIKPNSRAINPAIQAASELNLLKAGKELHCYTIRNCLEYDPYVGTILIDMYIKNDSMVKAQSTFNLMKNRNIVTWNSLISGHAYKGHFEDAIKLLKQMEDEEGIKPDTFTWTGLVFGYSFHGQVKDALDILHHMEVSGSKNTSVSWNAAVSGFSRSGNHANVIQFFKEMILRDMKPNPATISSTLQSCAALSLLKTGKEIHSFCTRNGFFGNAIVATALINMYSKSGSLESASEIFWRTKDKTVGTWNSMIAGYAIHSCGKKAVKLFEVMCQMGVIPDAVTFTALLSGCKNSGLLEEGWKYFDRMKSYYIINPTIEHYSCMVDLLGRSGYLDEAWDFIQTMPVKPDASIWGAVLRSCRTHKNLKLGKIAAEHLFELEPFNSANYVLLMNLYSMASRWRDVDQLKEKMIARGIKAQSSRCWIQIDHKVHVFSENEAHPDAGEIYFELYQLISRMKDMGYVPDVQCVYQQMDDAKKEAVLMSHPEKLAITYGLIKKRSSSPIRVIKNTRVCPDCHTTAKLISLIRNCEIFLKDGVRFHHFREGKCSCNDCWYE